jgi:PHS family inorganic phosphate transporter-like MFS transporter
MGRDAAETSPLVPRAGGEKHGGWPETLKLAGTAGAGLLADGYDLSVINMALTILEKLYPTAMTASTKGLIASMTLVGVIVGQLSFGFIADIVGRKAASIATTTLTIGGAILSSCVFQGGVWSLGLQLVLCRFLLGLGIGGEYPLSAAISKEVGPEDLKLTRSQLLIMNMNAFNFGVAIQSILTITLLSCPMALGTVWRVMLACGAAPSALALILRMQMEEPDATDLEGVVHERRDRQSWQHELLKVVESRWAILLGACLSWMVFNFVSYGEGTFSSVIAEAFLGKEDDTLNEGLVRDAVFVFVQSLCSIAGNFIGMYLEPRITRRDMQVLGFVGLALANWLDGGLYGVLVARSAWVLAVIFCLSSCCTSLLGITTYLVPAENFPPIARGTCVGLAAASGKVGAAIGAGLFPVTEYRLGLSPVMIFCGFMMLAGCFLTWRLTPAYTTKAIYG